MQYSGRQSFYPIYVSQLTQFQPRHMSSLYSLRLINTCLLIRCRPSKQESTQGSMKIMLPTPLLFLRNVKGKTVNYELSKLATKQTECFKCHGLDHFSFQHRTWNLLMDKIHDERQMSIRLKRKLMKLKEILVMLRTIEKRQAHTCKLLGFCTLHPKMRLGLVKCLPHLCHTQ